MRLATKLKIPLCAVWFMSFFCPSLVQAQLVNRSEQKDSITTVNYYKNFFISLGVGTAEFTNLNFGLRVYEGLYLTANVGSTFVRDGDSFFGFSGSTFYKVGVTWRSSQSEATFLGGFEIGEARLDVQESYSTLYVPDRANIVSFLAGYEWRYKGDFTLTLRGGMKYSKIKTKEGQFTPGIQISTGFWIF